MDYKIDKAKRTDAKKMLELNYRIYPGEFHVSDEYVHHIMDKNVEVYTVLRCDDDIKGIHSLFPLEKEIYDKVLNGEIEEHKLADYLLDYDEPKEVYLYLISLIVDIHDNKRKLYAKKIIQNIPLELERIESKGIVIKEIGAIAVSEDGEKICPKIGLQFQKKIQLYEQTYPIFTGTPEDIKKAVRQD